MGETRSPRTARVLDRLRRLRMFTTLGAGFVLGLGVPKRLVLAALTVTAITTSGIRSSGQVVLVVVYVAVATVLVWGPVILFVVFGDRSVALMQRGQEEVVRRQPEVTVYALLLLAALLTADAVGILLTEML